MDPLTALIVASVAAWFLIRDGGPAVTEARGLVPHTANNRHAERMQRMQHAHERWMARTAERREMRQQGGMVRQAVQRRLADWVMNAGRRVERVEDRRRAAEERDVRVGRIPGRWRTAWRDAREYLVQMQRLLAQRAERRFATRPTIFTKVIADDSTGPSAADEAPETKPEAPRPEHGPLPAPPGQRSYAQRPATGSANDDISDAEIVEDPAPAATPPGTEVIDAEIVEPEAPKIPASRQLEAAAPPSNVIPIKRGEHMTQPTQTLVLSSGAITPESGKTFADGGSDVLAQVASFTQNAVADMTAAKVAPEQIAEFTEAMNLVLAAKSKFGSMSENFTNHINAKAVVNSVGAGTDADYLGNGNS